MDFRVALIGFFIGCAISEMALIVRNALRGEVRRRDWPAIQFVLSVMSMMWLLVGAPSR